METQAVINYKEAEEGEILNDDPEELYVPLERPHIPPSKAAPSTSLPSAESDDDSASKESSDSDSSIKKLNSSKIRRKTIREISKLSGEKKKNYNIWSSDIQTEVLTKSLVDCNVDLNKDRSRDVESYNYRLGRINNENEFKGGYGNSEMNNQKQYSTKRRHDGAYVGEKMKNKVVEKQKQNKCYQSNARNILALSTNVENSEEEIARDIANKLYETKEELILRALTILGKEFVISLFEETKKIEASGGMMVMNGTRRRTPGGVFFYLLKSSEAVPREKINLVLSEDKKTRTEEKKLKSKKNRELQAEKLKKSLSEDDFPTLLSRTELAIKEFKARRLAEDSAEVKNPPPSPATDGKECSSDGEEQKEGNDNNRVKKCTPDRKVASYDDNLFDNEEKDSLGLVQCFWSLTVQWLCFVMVLTADDPDEELYKLNYSIKDILSPDSNNYLNFDFNAFWSHNESYYLSKLDDFDVFNIQDVHANDFDATTEKPWWRNSQNSNLKGAGTNPKDPIFDNNLVTNVTVQLGETAFLRCRVRNLGERPVSWVRRRDWHILTSGMFTYTNDERFQVAHTEGGDDWNLQIKYVQKRDNGTYECQVATGRGTISHYYNLHVVVPSAFILGSGEYHIGEGSTISLVCIIENSPSPPQYVFWYHNERMINYDTSRGGVTVSTEPGPKTHSRLIINSATTSDSGNYTCRASNTEADTIYVFVSKGDNTAAIQRQESLSARCGPLPLYIIISTTFNVIR